MRPAWKRLMRRTHGAVMVVGLLFACFLAGALWYVIGVGDAVVFRDRMQEAADAVAFSSAVIHARGMNFIVVCNIIMFALTAIYAVLAIVTDIAETLQFFVGLPPGWLPCLGWPEFGSDCSFRDDFWMCPLVETVALDTKLVCDCLTPCIATAAVISLIPYVGEVIGSVIADSCCPVATVIKPVEELIADNFFPRYFGIFQPVMHGIAILEYAIAFPITQAWAEAASVQQAGTYQQTGFMLSLSLIPDSAVQGLVSTQNQHGNQSHDPEFEFALQKIGLPVYSLKQRGMCPKVFIYPIDWLINTIGIPFPISWLMKAVGNWLGNVFANHYCGRKVENENSYGGDKFWHSSGMKSVYSPAENGNDWMQVWGFIVGAGANKPDTARNIVGLPSHAPSAAVNLTGAPQSNMYVAQSEFFFDCDDVWNKDHCNGSGTAFNGDGGFAVFVPHWRARLRRVHEPAFFTDLIGAGVAGIFTSANQGVISQGIQNLLGPLASKLGGIGTAGLKLGANWAVGQAGKLVTAAGQKIGTAIDGNGVVNTTIH
jgi:hypothetical protein